MSLDAWPRIAVVGATGCVGREALAILAQRGVAADRVLALASARSAGRRIPYTGAQLRVGALDDDALRGVDLALFMADAATARAHAPAALDAGVTVIDNSSAFRADPRAPLVVPEVNGRELAGTARPVLVANPNCSTILMLVALEPLRRAFGIIGVDVCTYQAVSGAGGAAMDELLAQTRAALDDEVIAPAAFHEPCAFNVFSHDAPTDPVTGVNGEERKMIEETRRIWGDAAVRICPTCVRVPALRAHTLALLVTLRRPASEAQVRESLAKGEGLRIVDDRSANRFPTPRNATGRDEVLVGRIRPDPCAALDRRGRTRRWCALIAGDQLRKGAALNGVQIGVALGRRVLGEKGFGPGSRTRAWWTRSAGV